MVWYSLGFPGGSDGSLPEVCETCVQSMGQGDPLEKEMATHSTILAWKISWIEKPGRLHMFSKSQTQLSNFTIYIYIWYSLRMVG